MFIGISMLETAAVFIRSGTGRFVDVVKTLTGYISGMKRSVIENMIGVSSGRRVVGSS